MIGSRVWKILQVAALGLLIWSLTLVWPEVNLLLAWPALVGLTLAFGSILLITLKLWHLAPGLTPVPGPEGYSKADTGRVQSRPVRLTPR